MRSTRAARHERAQTHSGSKNFENNPSLAIKSLMLEVESELVRRIGLNDHNWSEVPTEPLLAQVGVEILSRVRFLVTVPERGPVALQPRRNLATGQFKVSVKSSGDVIRVTHLLAFRLAGDAFAHKLAHSRGEMAVGVFAPGRLLFRTLRGPCAHASTTIAPVPGSSTVRGILHLKLFETFRDDLKVGHEGIWRFPLPRVEVWGYACTRKVSAT